MAWKFHTVYTSKLPPETVWDYMTNYTPDDHGSEAFVQENGGTPWVRTVRRIDNTHVELHDKAKRWEGTIVVDLSDKPNSIKTSGGTTMGSWKGETKITRTPEGGTAWDFDLEMQPKGFMKFMMLFIGGGMKKGFKAHGQQHFSQMEEELARGG